MARSPAAVAEAIRRYFEEGVDDGETYTDPYIAWHCYDGLEKVARSGHKLDEDDAATRAARLHNNRYHRVRVLPGETSVTCLLTSDLTLAGDREVRLHVCLVHMLDDDMRVFRVEAYYDPRELERDAWLRMHLAMYEGVVGNG